MDPASAWILALASMTAVFLIVYYKKSNMPRALLYSLILGKVYAGVFWMLDIDYPIAAIYRTTPYGYYPVHTITANMIIFLLFLSSALTTLFWPEISRELRRELRSAMR